MKEKNKVIIKTIVYIAIYLFLIILKHILFWNFPIRALTGAVEDDALMINLADNIRNGMWLGTYKYDTLMKGPMFPLILALIDKLNISYMFFITVLYTISCVIFIIAIRKKIKNKIVKLVLFGVMLFNPIMMCNEIVQRVYRNSLTPAFSIIIISGYFGIFLRRDEKVIKLIPWVLLEIFVLPIFYYSREDTIWILPYLAFVIFAIVVGLIFKEKKINKTIIIKILIILIPIVSVKITGYTISKINEKYYGLKIVNVLTDKNSSFTDVVQSIYSVKPNVEIDKVNLTLEKVDRISAVSGNFAKISDSLKSYIAGYNVWDSNPSDGELEDGWMSWALRSAACDNGYKTLEEDNELWANIAHEINLALEDGRLEYQVTMPISTLPPWRASYFKTFVNSFFEANIYVGTFKDVSMQDKRTSTQTDYSLFEDITNDNVILTNDDDNDTEYLEEYNLKRNIMNDITQIYKIILPVLGIISIVYYFILSIIVIKNFIQKNFYFLENWIIISGILGAYLTLILGITYTNTATVSCIRVLYLGGAHSLYLMFTLICVYNIIKLIYIKMKMRKTKRILEKS